MRREYERATQSPEEAEAKRQRKAARRAARARGEKS